MASAQKIRLLVRDDQEVIVVDDEIECSATGEELFNEMNRRCEFGKWERADMWVDKAVFAVSNSGNASQDQAYAKAALQNVIAGLPTLVAPCRLTLQVQKKGDDSDYQNSDAPGGPVAPKNPGLQPLAGPNYGGFETPAGPEGRGTQKKEGARAGEGGVGGSDGAGTLARMRGLLALGAPLGGRDQVDQEEVQVAYRDIILRERYRWPEAPGGPRLRDASADVTIRVYENESLYDKLDQRRPFWNWISMNCWSSPLLAWRKESPSGMVQTVQHTRERVDSWKQELFGLVPGGDPPILELRHTDANFVSTLQSGRPRSVRDAAAWPPTRRP